MRGSEKQVLLSMLDDMIQHFSENKSILAKIYGLYTIKTNKFAPVDIIIMENTMSKIKRHNKSMIFDLKGSLKHRITNFPKSENCWWLKKDKGHKKCMKDQNFLIINKDLNYKLIDIPE